MARSSSQSKTPAWDNRWDKPNLNQLLTPLKAHQKRPFEQMVRELESIDGLERSVTWFGASWKWTIQYHPQGKPDHPVCYLVPDLETPKVCVPLSDPDIDQLPLRRLSKFIRDGIKAAKCALNTHWAIWSPVSRNEAEMVVELVGRKHTAPPPTPAAPSQAQQTKAANTSAKPLRGKRRRAG